MAEEMENLLGDWITSGLVIIPDYLRPTPRNRRIRYHQATHPIPTSKGVEGVLAMLRLVDDISRDDLVIVLVSGGGSALMPLPVEGIFFFQAEDGIRDIGVTGVQTCALPISSAPRAA